MDKEQEIDLKIALEKAIELLQKQKRNRRRISIRREGNLHY